MRQRAITLGGKTYPLRMTMGVLLAYTRTTGLELSESGGGIEQEMLLLWLCLRSASRADGVEFSLTLDELSDVMSPDDFVLAQAILAEASGDEDACASSGTSSGTSSDEGAGAGRKKKRVS